MIAVNDCCIKGEQTSMISTKSIKEKMYSEKEGELTMFDDIKKGEKIKERGRELISEHLDPSTFKNFM